METTLATILVTITSTVVVTGLSIVIWAIVQLRRKVSQIEVLCSNYEQNLVRIYKSFEDYNRKQDEQIKNTKFLRRDLDEHVRDRERFNNSLKQNLKKIYEKIELQNKENEKILDKRLDTIYRKMYSKKQLAE